MGHRLPVAPAAAGAVAGLFGAAGVLACDQTGLAGMMARDPLGYVAGAVLALAFTGTFAAAAFGAALAAADDGDS
jgi:hypothetical protein